MAGFNAKVEIESAIVEVHITGHINVPVEIDNERLEGLTMDEIADLVTEEARNIAECEGHYEIEGQMVYQHCNGININQGQYGSVYVSDVALGTVTPGG
tara:strand:- start:109 stop:405 length:297 start_codon:yes stop_codon:yes gene_type:complete